MSWKALCSWKAILKGVMGVIQLHREAMMIRVREEHQRPASLQGGGSMFGSSQFVAMESPMPPPPLPAFHGHSKKQEDGAAVEKWNSSWIEEVPSEAQGGCSSVSTSHWKSVRSGQPVSERGVVPRVSFQMEDRNDKYTTQGLTKGSCGVAINARDTVTKDIADTNEAKHPIISMERGELAACNGKWTQEHEVQLRTSCRKTQGEEGGPHQRSTLLQVSTEDLRVLHVGSTGAGNSEERDSTSEEGSRGKPRSHEDERGAGGVQEGAGREGAEGEREAHARSSTRGSTDGADRGGASREEASGGYGEPPDAVPSTDET